MAQSADTIRLVELVCARMCHDLGGLIGTVGNALELVTEDAVQGNEIFAFASTAAKVLVQRLRLIRAAWGPETEAITKPALLAMVTPTLASRHIELDTRTLAPDGVFPAATGRVALNLILLAGDCLPKGGTIRLLGRTADLLVRIEGPDAAWPSGLIACLQDETKAVAALTSARSMQMPLTVLLAAQGGLSLSPVLGSTSGIEALRLVTP